MYILQLPLPQRKCPETSGGGRTNRERNSNNHSWGVKSGHSNVCHNKTQASRGFSTKELKILFSILEKHQHNSTYESSLLIHKALQDGLFSGITSLKR